MTQQAFTLPNMNQILLIGGNPKGYREAFSEETKAGKVLHAILKDLEAEDFVYLADCWSTPEEEKAKTFRADIMESLWAISLNWYPPIALGKYQYDFLRKHLPDVKYLPHPASRHPKHIEKLKLGLRAYLVVPKANSI